jgi:DNA-binding NtrC family response regulator
VLASEEPVLLEPGLDRDLDAPREAASIPLEVRSVLAAPLGKGRALEGLVYLESPRSKRTFTASERTTLTALCDLAASHLEARRAAGQGQALGRLYQAELRGHQELSHIVGSSPAMQAVHEQVRRAGPTEVTTLVLGESGTGKELVAGALHRLSPRAGGPFVAVNCAALPSELVESELFGHRKGAFSGAAGDRPGRFQLADGGTLFLDELADLPAAAQAKLLRALETRRVQRLGGGPEEPVDVRLVAATRADLPAEVEAGRFREDLYFRLGVFTIRMPPLRERLEDLPDLVESLVGLLARLHRRPVEGVTAQALELLRAHDWPGNVRELRNVLEQAVVRASGAWIGPSDLGLAAAPGRSHPVYPDELDAARALFERQHIGRILGEVSGDVEGAAKRLGVARSSLYKRLKDLDLDPAEYR